MEPRWAVRVHDPMYERFTDNARTAMQQANGSAKRRKHEYIGTEHILLGLVEHGAGVAVSVLNEMSIDLTPIPSIIDSTVQHGERDTSRSRLPHTPRAKKVIEYAMEEARSLGHRYVGTEHLLLGLLRVRDGLAAHALEQVHVDLTTVRDAVIEHLDTPEFHNRNEELARRADTFRFSLNGLMRALLGGKDDSTTPE